METKKPAKELGLQVFLICFDDYQQLIIKNFRQAELVSASHYNHLSKQLNEIPKQVWNDVKYLLYD